MGPAFAGAALEGAGGTGFFCAAATATGGTGAWARGFSAATLTGAGGSCFAGGAGIPAGGTGLAGSGRWTGIRFSRFGIFFLGEGVRCLRSSFLCVFLRAGAIRYRAVILLWYIKRRRLGGCPSRFFFNSGRIRLPRARRRGSRLLPRLPFPALPGSGRRGLLSRQGLDANARANGRVLHARARERVPLRPFEPVFPPPRAQDGHARRRTRAFLPPSPLPFRGNDNPFPLHLTSCPAAQRPAPSCPPRSSSRGSKAAGT